MVNVNAQVSSSVEPPFGEYDAGVWMWRARTRSAAVAPGGAICVWRFRTARIQEVCQRHGGCLRKRPWEPGLMATVVLRCECRLASGFDGSGLITAAPNEMLEKKCPLVLLICANTARVFIYIFTVKYLFRRYSHI